MRSVTFCRVLLFLFAAITTFGGGSAEAFAQSKTATSTGLALSSGGVPVSTLASGSVVTFTATVTAGTTKVNPGQVKFCDAAATYCTDGHLLGTAQLTTAGVAVLKFRPALGSHSYKAVFIGTNTYATSSSAAAALAVTGVPASASTSTVLAQTGTWGTYSLSATVTGTGSDAPLSGTVSFADITSGNSVLTTAALGAGTSGMAWVNSQLLTVNSNPQYEAVGDFNGDGIPDLAITTSRSPVVTILLGKGDGTFTPGTSLAVIGSPEELVAADFNGDGNVDLAVLNYGATGTVAIFLGKGDGSFNAATSSPSAGIYPLSITVADFNGDGIADLAASDIPSGTVTVLLGNGDGTFSTTQVNVPNSTGNYAVAAGDFNGDGKPDLAVQFNTQVTILAGNGDGTFTAWSTTDMGAYTHNLAVADFNGDGKLDLVATSIDTSAVTVLLNNGDSTFSLVRLGSSVPTEPSWVSVGDFNGDGIPDIAYVQSEIDTLFILLGKGDGTFVDPGVRPAAGTGYLAEPYSIGVGDFNGDGKDDLAVPIYFLNTVNIYLSEPTRTATATAANLAIAGVGLHQVDAAYAGSSSFQAGVSNTIALWGQPPATATTLTVSSGGAPATTVAAGTAVTLAASVVSGTTPLTTGQVNFCDASATTCTDAHLIGSGSLTINGTASFKFIPGPGQHTYKAVMVENANGLASTSTTLTLTVTAPLHVTVPTTTTIDQGGSINNYTLTATVAGVGSTAPLTGNVSFLDSSYANKSLASVAISTSTPGLAFPIASSNAFTNVGFLATAAGDFNGDGIPDLAAVNTNSMAVTILLGNGDGTFKTTAGPTLSAYATSVVASDFNGDGKLDLAVSLSAADFYSTGSMALLIGNGDGTFSISGGAPTVGNSPKVFAVADFNADGKMDLLVNDATGTRILLGNGDGTFSQAPATGLSVTLVVADLNGDGFPDLISGSYPSSVSLGNGDGTFRSAPPGLLFSSPPPPAVAGDFNGDGIPDVAIIGSFYSPVTIYLGNGDGTFTAVPPGTNPAVNEPGGLAAVDLNHDGKLDLVITNLNSYSGNLQNPDLIFLLGNGDGTFTSIPGDIQLSGTWAISTADFNGDGIPDLAVGTGAGISVLLTEPSQTATVTATGVSPSGPIPHMVDASYLGDSNFKGSTSATTSLDIQVMTPVFIPPSGTYTSGQIITITEATPGATVYYSLNSNTYPVVWTAYTGPITINTEGSFSFQAYASENGYEQSAVATASYTLDLPPAPIPVISPGSGSYATSQTVTITDTAPGVSIYYTLDGSVPTTSSTPYTGPITVSTSETVVAIATGGGYNTSLPGASTIVINSVASAFIYTVAGSGSFGYAGDNGQATAAMLNGPTITLVDGSGNLYIADGVNSVVRKVDAGSGIITTIAGNGSPGYSGDNGPATSAQIEGASGILLDASGNLYVSDAVHGVVRKVTASTGIITTIAGNITATALGDNGPATSAQVPNAAGLALDGSGNLYIASFERIRKVNLSSGVITTYAGTGNFGSGGDGGPANIAVVAQPWGLALDSAGTLYFTDIAANVVRKISAAGTIMPVAGLSFNASNASIGDGGPAINAVFNGPYGVSVDASGNVYIADSSHNEIRAVTASTGVINKVIGYGPSAPCSGLSGDGGPAASSGLCFPYSITFDAAGNMYIAERGMSRVRKVTVAALPPTSPAASPAFNVQAGTYALPQTVTITSPTPGAAIYVTLDGRTPSATGSGYHGPISVTGPVTIKALAVAPGFLASDVVTSAYTITMLPQSVIDTIAGNGTSSGVVTPGAPATSESFGWLNGLGVDAAGDVYIPDASHCVVWMVSATTGNATVFAGTLNSCAELGDDGPAGAASLAGPTHVALDTAGNLFITDSWYGRIRKVQAGTGIITTYAGGGQYSQNIGDNGPATLAYLYSPNGIAVDGAGNLYIADTNHYRVRRVNTAGIITTYAGGGTAGLGEGGAATSATLSYPYDIAVDGSNNLYIADQYNGRVRMVASQTGIISTVAGNGDPGMSGDGLLATAAEVYPLGLAVDTTGNVYIANYPNSVRVVNATSHVISTVAGTGYSGFSGDGGSATMANLCEPYGLAAGKSGAIYISDACNFRVRKVTYPSPAPTPVISLPAGSYLTAQSVIITDSAQNATIYYTIDGSTPNTASTIYSEAIAVSSSETVKAIAVASGYSASAVASATYQIGTPAATPAFNPPAGSYIGTQSVSITCATTGSTIYYTTDGSTPTTASAKYASPITVAESETLNAIAVATGYNPSGVASAAYIISNPVPVLISLSPPITTAGGPAFTLTANGSGFTATSSVRWGSSALVTQFVDGTKLTASVPAANIATAGISAISVQTASSGGAASNSLQFETDTAGSTPPSFTTLTATVSPGSTATYAVSLPASATGVSVTCLNLPSGSSCSYSAAALSISTSATTPAGTYQITAVFTETLPGAAKAWIFLPIFLLPLAAARKRATGRIWFVALLGLVIAAAAGGCGGGGGGTPTQNPTHQVRSSGVVTLTVQ